MGLDFERQRYDFKTYLCRVENADISGDENAAGVHKQGVKTENNREPRGNRSDGENDGFGGDENDGFGGDENAAGVHKQGVKTESNREPRGNRSDDENDGFGGGENAAGVHKQGVKTEA